MANFIGVDLYGQQTIDVQDTAARIELPNKADKDLYNVDPADVLQKIPTDTTVDSTATNGKLPTTKAVYDAISALNTAIDSAKADKDLDNVDPADVFQKIPVDITVNSTSTNAKLPTSKAVYDAVDGAITGLKSSYASLKVATRIAATQDTPADLNTYTTPGNYTVNTSTIAGYVSNNPRPSDPSAFKLYVLNKEDTATVIIQIVVYYLRPYAYIRWSGDSGSTWLGWYALNNIQANWSQGDSTADDYIKNKPGTVTLNALVNSSAGTSYLFTPAIMREGIRVLSNPVDTSAKTLVEATDNGLNGTLINRIYKEYTFSTPLATNATWTYTITEAANATYVYDMKVIGFTAGGEAVPLTINYMAIGSHADSGDISFTNQYSADITKVMIMVDYSL